MHAVRTPSILVAAILLLAGCTADPTVAAGTQATPAGAPLGNTCVTVARVSGWSVEDDRLIQVTVGASDRYRVELSGVASSVALRSVSRIALVPNAVGELCARGGHVVADGRRIPVDRITRLADGPPAG